MERQFFRFTEKVNGTCAKKILSFMLKIHFKITIFCCFVWHLLKDRLRRIKSNRLCTQTSLLN